MPSSVDRLVVYPLQWLSPPSTRHLPLLTPRPLQGILLLRVIATFASFTVLM